MVNGIYQQLYQIIQGLLWAYGYVLIGTAVISWIPDLMQTQFGQVLMRVTQPYMQIFRRFIPSIPIGGVSLDLSYMVGVIVYFLVQNVVLSVLYAVLKGLLGG